jgi:hypothetical protein
MRTERINKVKPDPERHGLYLSDALKIVKNDPEMRKSEFIQSTSTYVLCMKFSKWNSWMRTEWINKVKTDPESHDLWLSDALKIVKNDPEMSKIKFIQSISTDILHEIFEMTFLDEDWTD